MQLATIQISFVRPHATVVACLIVVMYTYVVVEESGGRANYIYYIE